MCFLPCRRARWVPVGGYQTFIGIHPLGRGHRYPISSTPFADVGWFTRLQRHPLSWCTPYPLALYSPLTLSVQVAAARPVQFWGGIAVCIRRALFAPTVPRLQPFFFFFGFFVLLPRLIVCLLHTISSWGVCCWVRWHTWYFEFDKAVGKLFVFRFQYSISVTAVAGTLLSGQPSGCTAVGACSASFTVAIADVVGER